MPNAQVIPGYVFSPTPPPGELVTYAKLNQLGNPVVTIPAQTPSSGINYLRNGNFYTQSWATPTGVSCPVAATAPLGTVNALYWECLPAGAAITYSQDTRVPNAFSIYSTKLTGATSATTVFFQQQIQSDFSVELAQNVTFSCWIFNNTGSTISPVLNINTATVKDTWTSQSSFALGATANLQACANNAWTQVSATINLTSVLNVNNGIQVQLVFSSGTLANSSQSINLSQMQLVIGTAISAQFLDDYTFSLPPTPSAVANSLGYAPLSEGIINSVTNGSFDVFQTGTSLTNLGASTPASDAWRLNNNATTQMSLVQTASTSSDAFNSTVPYMAWKPYYGLWTVTTALASPGVSDFLIIRNMIEGYDITNLAYRNLSLSFWVKATLSGAYCVALRNSTPDRELILQYTINAANTWQYVQFPNLPVMNVGSGTWNLTNGLGLSLDFCLMSGSNFQTSTTNSWLSSGTFLSTPSQTNLAATNGNTFAITGVQLEPGPLVSQYQYIPFDRQHLKCQRYYYKSFAYGTVPASNVGNGFLLGNWPGTTIIYFGHKFPQEMRIAPTITSFNPSASNAGIRDLNSATDIAFSSAGVSTIGLDYIVTGAATAGHAGIVNIVADSRL